MRSVHRACRVAGQLSRLRTEDQTVDGIYRTEGPRVRWNTRLLLTRVTAGGSCVLTSVAVNIAWFVNDDLLYSLDRVKHV